MKSDRQIQQNVIDALAVLAPDSSTMIGVTVRGGAVTLSGHVGSYEIRLRAEELAHGVVGVQALGVDLQLVQAGRAILSDGDLVLAVRSILQWQTTLPLMAVVVLVRHGWVTLRGEIEGYYPRQKVIDAVRVLAGVRGIHDHVTFKSQAVPAQLQQVILAALEQRTEVDARAVAVAVHGAEVTLTGSVQSWRESEMVRQCAWGAAGVRQVHDRLEVYG
jgi:osmotically-inducible protein OsmY